MDSDYKRPTFFFSFHNFSPQHIPALITIFEQEIRRGLQFGFSKENIDRIKQKISKEQSSRKTSQKNTVNLIEDMLWNERMGKITMSAEEEAALIQKKLKEINAESVNRAFQFLWQRTPVINIHHYNHADQKSAAFFTRIYQESRKTPLQALSKETNQAKVQTQPSAFAYSSFGKAGKVSSFSSAKKDGIVRMKLSNNIHLNIYEISGLKDTYLTLSLDGGQYQCGKNASYLSYLEGFPLMGLGEYSLHEIETAFPNRKSRISLRIEEDAFVITDIIKADEFKQELKILTAFLLDPGWREEWVTTVKNHLPSLQQQAFANKHNLLQAYYKPLLFKGHACTEYQKLTEIESVDTQSLKDFFAPVLSQSAVEISVVSGVSEKKVVTEILRTLGTLPKRAVEFKAEKQKFLFPKPGLVPETLYHYGEGEDTLATIFWPVDLSKARKENLKRIKKESRALKNTGEKQAGKLGEAQGSIQKREAEGSICWAVENLAYAFKEYVQQNLREKEGVTYHVTPVFYCQKEITDHSFIGLSLDISPEQADWVYQKIATLSEQFQQKEARYMIGQSLALSYMDFKRKYNDDIFSILDITSQVQRNPDFDNFYQKKDNYYRTVQEQEIQDLAAEVLMPSKAWKLLIKPYGGLKTAHEHNEKVLKFMSGQ